MNDYKDRTGNLRPQLKCTLHEFGIAEAYLSYLNKHKDLPPTAFDAFQAGYESVEQYGWISVKDRLPDGNEYELFVYRHGGIIMLVHYAKEIFDKFPDIEYWMPYPLPPVELQKPVRIIVDPCEVEVEFEKLILTMRKNAQSKENKDQ